MDALGLPDPVDYSAPANGPIASTPTAYLAPPAPAEPANLTVPAATEITPFPADPPIVTGDTITQSVYQAGV